MLKKKRKRKKGGGPILFAPKFDEADMLRLK